MYLLSSAHLLQYTLQSNVVFSLDVIHLARKITNSSKLAENTNFKHNSSASFENIP